MAPVIVIGLAGYGLLTLARKVKGSITLTVEAVRETRALTSSEEYRELESKFGLAVEAVRQERMAKEAAAASRTEEIRAARLAKEALLCARAEEIRAAREAATPSA